jgi:hypothetical protein
MSVVSKCGSGSANAFVSISIDAETTPYTSSAAKSPAAAQSVVAELFDRFNQLRIAGSWAICQPATTPLLQQIVGSPLGHETALLADPALAKSDLSRTDLMQAVVHPLQSAAEAGLSISTLAVGHSWQPRHIDLLTKYGLTLIRTPHVFSSQTTTGIRAVCYGLWHVPVSATLKGGGWMANLAQWRFARKTVERAILHGGWCHLRIDAASLATGDTICGLRTVDRLLRHLVQLRAAGHITVETLRDTATRLTPKRNSTAAHSILHAA